MNCRCRTSALRIFVRSITQIQLSAAARNSSPCQPLLLLSSGLRDDGGFRRPRTAIFTLPRLADARGFHASRARDSAAGDVASALEGVERIEASSDAGRGRKRAENSTGGLRVSAIEERPDRRDSVVTESAALSPGGPNVSTARPRSSPPNRPRQRRTEKTAGGEEDRQLASKAKKKKKTKQTKRAEEEEEASGRAPVVKEDWQIQKAALKEKFPEGWSPRKKLSPDAVAGIRALHRQFPEECTTEVLARQFEVSPEVIRRILKSKWTPSAEEEMDRQERWFGRGKRIWSRLAELGAKPPLKWRKEGITRDPIWHERKGSRARTANGVSAARLRRKRLAENLM